MLLPFNDSGAISGVFCGVLFGYVLENSGFGSPHKLTAQFRLHDWSVFKVMFTAIVVAAAGLYGLRVAGFLSADAVFVPPALLMAAALGGVFVGAGFAIGGYCPGTSVVGAFSGRVDAIVFLLGLLVGTVGFADIYGPAVEKILAMWALDTGDTVTDAYGVSEPVILCIMVVALTAIYALGAWFERRSHGPVSAEQAVSGANLHS
jgi:uncharacterized protein